MDWKLIVESGASIRHILASHGSTKTGKQTTMRKLTNLLTNWWNKRERISRLILNGLNSWFTLKMKQITHVTSLPSPVGPDPIRV